MKIQYFILMLFSILLTHCSENEFGKEVKTSGNHILHGWYADPEGAVFGSEYWIYPTYSARYDEQVFLDAFSSMVHIIWSMVAGDAAMWQN